MPQTPQDIRKRIGSLGSFGVELDTPLRATQCSTVGSCSQKKESGLSEQARITRNERKYPLEKSSRPGKILLKNGFPCLTQDVSRCLFHLISNLLYPDSS